MVPHQVLLRPGALHLVHLVHRLARGNAGAGREGTFMSLLPATAAIIGIVVLAQVPSPADVLAVTLVVAAVAIRRSRSVGAHAPASSASVVTVLQFRVVAATPSCFSRNALFSFDLP